MLRSKDKELVTIDLASMPNPAELMNQLEPWLMQLNHQGVSAASPIELITGEILLSPSQIVKLRSLALRYGYLLDTVCSSVPQTQQAALDEGLTVKNISEGISAKKAGASLPNAINSLSAVDLPFPKAEAQQTAPTGLQQLIEQTAIKTAVHSPLSEKNDDGSFQPIAIPADSISDEVLLYRQNLRSGQVLRSDGHIVVIGDAHAGSEIIAGGDVYVWGVLNGIAHAGISQNGVNKNQHARIRAFRIEAIQLRIAGIIARRPDRLFKTDNNSSNESTAFKTEMAKIVDGEIQVFEENIRSFVH